MKFYQACYGKPHNVNWELFHTSADIPFAASAFYEKAESNNVPQNMPKDDLCDSEGRAKDFLLTEILTRDSMVCVNQVKYGAADLDAQGRRKMFAHGFIFMSENIWSDPNFILSVSDKNFKFDSDATEAIPANLLRDRPYTVAEALQAIGRPEGDIIRLVACVYISLTSNTDFPIYIVSSKKEEVLKPVFYCICRSLPYPLRYVLSVSNSNNFERAQFKSLMFVDSIPANGSYFNLDTGESNMNPESLDRSEDRFPFYHRLKQTGIDRFSNYCDLLQFELIKMQLSSSRDYNILKLADIVMQGVKEQYGRTDESLTRLLFAVASYAPLQNSYVDAYLADLLSNYDLRGLIPNDVLMNKLRVRAEKTDSAAFVALYERLQIRCLLSSGTLNAVEFLLRQRESGQEHFLHWFQYLADMKNGPEVAAEYCIARIRACTSLETLLKVYEDCGQLTSFDQIVGPLDEKSQDITLRALTAEPVAADSCCLALDEYKNFFETVMSGESKKDFSDRVDSLTNEYWNRFSIASFAFTEAKINSYQCMEKFDHPTFIRVQSLMKLYHLVKQPYALAPEVVLETIEVLLEKIERDWNVSTQEGSALARQIQGFLLSGLYEYQRQDLLFWYHVATFGRAVNPGINSFAWMIVHKLPVITSDYDFDRAVCDPKVADRLGSLILMIGESNGNGSGPDGIDPKSEDYKLLKRRVSRLCEREKELRREQKERRKELDRQNRGQEKLGESNPPGSEEQKGHGLFFFGNHRNGRH